MMGGQVGIVGHLRMGDNIKYGAQAGVTKNMKVIRQLLVIQLCQRKNILNHI